MRPLFLIGFMAVGKTTLGRALAARCPGMRFVDLDAEVEAAEGCSVGEIFATRGEEAFRALESDMLRRVAADGCVVACGGGTPCRPANMDFMLGAGTVVWLQASPGRVAARLLEAPEGQRPLADRYRSDPEALAAFIERMEAERAPHYSRAHLTFDADGLDTADEVEESSRRFLELIS